MTTNTQAGTVGTPSGDCGLIDLVSALLLVSGSAGEAPAVVVMRNAAPADTVNVLVQVMAASLAKLATGTLGVHVCTAPDGKPLSTHVAAVATLGPALVQVPLTVMRLPANTFDGTVVLARMSA